MRLLLTALLAVAAPQAPDRHDLQAPDGPIERLKPGESFWAPELAPEGPVAVVVSLPTQRAYVYRNGVPIGVTTVSTGKPGHETPVGVYTILQKRADHRSNLYANAPMPFMQRLTWDGIALHAGKLPGHPASHGCVRLPIEFARKLFQVTKVGFTVVVTDAREVPEVAPDAGAPLAHPQDGHAAPNRFQWRPDRSPHGPVSIVVSGRDRVVVVLRNGVEIGRAALALDAPIGRTEAFTLRAVDGTGTRWFRLPLPGLPARTGELSAEERAQGHVPDAFARAVRSVLTPGATMLVTRDTLATSGTGGRVALLEAR